MFVCGNIDHEGLPHLLNTFTPGIQVKPKHVSKGIANNPITLISDGLSPGIQIHLVKIGKPELKKHMYIKLTSSEDEDPAMEVESPFDCVNAKIKDQQDYLNPMVDQKQKANVPPASDLHAAKKHARGTNPRPGNAAAKKRKGKTLTAGKHSKSFILISSDSEVEDPEQTVQPALRLQDNSIPSDGTFLNPSFA